MARTLSRVQAGHRSSVLPSPCTVDQVSGAVPSGVSAVVPQRRQVQVAIGRA